VELRGVKLYTKGTENLYDNVFDALQSEIPWLDINHMSRPENGECLLDLGMSIYPETEENLVGLWNISAADASFAKGGLNTPPIHNIGTLSDYGGVAAEMCRTRSEATHLNYRMAYNLVYEIVRGNVYFCEDSDAYAGNAVFHKCFQNYISMYTKAVNRTYGVRDELLS